MQARLIVSLVSLLVDARLVIAPAFSAGGGGSARFTVDNNIKGGPNV